MLIMSFCHGRGKIEECSTRCDAYHNRLVGSLCYSECKEACRTLVGDRVAVDVRALVKVVYDGGIA